TDQHLAFITATGLCVKDKSMCRKQSKKDHQIQRAVENAESRWQAQVNTKHQFQISNNCISAKYCPILTNYTSMESLFIQLS
ncbi:hypothetical protein QQF64_025969, partial [Cirrhinus molitorella]